MAGGLCAMDRKMFFRMGAYDRQLTYWGGENVELSFRVRYIPLFVCLSISFSSISSWL